MPMPPTILSSAQATALRAAHARGLSNRAIAAELGYAHRTVAKYLSLLGLATNNPRRPLPAPVDETTSRCSSCGTVAPNEDFALVQSLADGRRLSKCKRCRADQNHANLTASPEAYLADRTNRVRARARASGIPFDLPREHLHTRWEAQGGGLCFYTDQPMQMADRTLRHSISVDRVDPHRGYLADNVVLCTNRANRIKSDLTLDELAAWLPGWHTRAVTYLEGART